MENIEELEEFNDKYILNEGYLLHKVILNAINSMSRGIEAGDIRNGMISKNLEIDQALKISICSGLFEFEELKDFLKKQGFEEKKDLKDLDKVINDTKKANYILGFILKKAKNKRPHLIKGII
jgi:hypothetical protein